MYHVMSRSMAFLVLILSLFSGLAAPALARPGGNEAVSAMCAGDGYLLYKDAEGNPFRNEGQCVRYGAQGEMPQPIVPEDDDGPISVDWFTATARQISDGAFGPRYEVVITGTQLEAGATVFLTLDSDGILGEPQPIGSVDENGTYDDYRIWGCSDVSNVASSTFETTDRFGSTVIAVAVSPCLTTGT